MPWITWAFVIPVWTCAVTTWIIIFKNVRRRRRELEARLQVARRVQDAAYEQARQNLTLMNRHLFAGNLEATMPPPQTTEQWQAAKDKAKNALLGFLSAKQRNDYMLRQHFDVKGQSGALYRLWSNSYVGNIEVLLNERHEVCLHDGPRFCVHLVHHGTHFPIEDHLLAQALMLKTSESELLAIAHRYN